MSSKIVCLYKWPNGYLKKRKKNISGRRARKSKLCMLMLMPTWIGVRCSLCFHGSFGFWDVLVSCHASLFLSLSLSLSISHRFQSKLSPLSPHVLPHVLNHIFVPDSPFLETWLGDNEIVQYDNKILTTVKFYTHCAILSFVFWTCFEKDIHCWSY